MSEILETTDTYNRAASYFAARWHGADIPAMVAARQCLVAWLHQGARVLDVGCGTGRDTTRLCELGFQVCGLDRSKGMLTEAHQHNPELSLILGDMYNLPMGNDSLDALWACASFLHIPKRHNLSVLHEFRRVLRHNGLCYMCVKRGQGERWVKDDSGLRRFFAFYSEPELEMLLQKAGFMIVERWMGNDHRGRPEPWLHCLAKKGDL